MTTEQSSLRRKEIRRTIIDHVYIRSFHDIPRSIFRESFRNCDYIFSILTIEDKIKLQEQFSKSVGLSNSNQKEEDIIVTSGLSLCIIISYDQIVELSLSQTMRYKWFVRLDRYGHNDEEIKKKGCELFIPRKLYEVWYSHENLELVDFNHSKLNSNVIPNWLETTFSSDALLGKLIRHITIWNQDWPGLLNLLSVSKSLNKRILNLGTTDQQLILSLREEFGLSTITSSLARSNLNIVLKNVRRKVCSHLVACKHCSKIFYCDYHTFESILSSSSSRKHDVYKGYYDAYHQLDDSCETVKLRRVFLLNRISSSLRNGRRYKLGSIAYLPRLTNIKEDQQETTKNNKRKRMIEEEEEEEEDDETDEDVLEEKKWAWK